MAEFFIHPDRLTLHGSFSKEFTPIVSINSGDTVRFETIDAGWNTGPFQLDGVREKFCERDHPQDSGHALTGPIYINGAKEGLSAKRKTAAGRKTFYWSYVLPLFSD